MTQLILEIESQDIVRKVKRLLSNIFGVRIIAPSKELKYTDTDTEDFLNEFSGCWAGDESAEDIKSNIREFRTSRPPVSFE